MAVNTFDYSTQMPRELQRIESVSEARPARHTGQAPRLDLAEVTRRLSRRGVAASKAELMNNVLAYLCDLVYESEEGAGAVNLEHGSGRILVPLPWGRLGYAKWGLRASEARTLRIIMLDRTGIESPAPWLDFDAGSRAWKVNKEAGYAQKRAAQAYLMSYPISTREWVDAARRTRTAWARGNGLGD